MMKIVVTLLCAGYLWSCSSAPKPETATEEPSPIVPVERDYGVSFDAAWSAVNDIFEEDEVPVEQADEYSGAIKTDYLYGGLNDDDYINIRSTMYKRSWVEELRYKLEIKFVSLSNEETRIIIEARIEGKLASTDSQGNAIVKGPGTNSSRPEAQNSTFSRKSPPD